MIYEANRSPRLATHPVGFDRVEAWSPPRDRLTFYQAGLDRAGRADSTCARLELTVDLALDVAPGDRVPLVDALLAARQPELDLSAPFLKV